MTVYNVSQCKWMMKKLTLIWQTHQFLLPFASFQIRDLHMKWQYCLVNIKSGGPYPAVITAERINQPKHMCTCYRGEPNMWTAIKDSQCNRRGVRQVFSCCIVIVFLDWHSWKWAESSELCFALIEHDGHPKLSKGSVCFIHLPTFWGTFSIDTFSPSSWCQCQQQQGFVVMQSELSVNCLLIPVGHHSHVHISHKCGTNNHEHYNVLVMFLKTKRRDDN